MELAINMALAVPYGTATSHRAMELCMVRGLDPNDYEARSPNWPPLMNWRWAIVEQVLAASIARDMGAI